jgi:hypothetical protein
MMSAAISAGEVSGAQAMRAWAPVTPKTYVVF